MALQLMKLVISANTTIDIDPVANKFFYVASSQTDAGTSLTIDAASFFQNDGSALSELPALTNNSYFNVYVNGVLQMDSLSTYTPGATSVGSLVIAVPAGLDPILNGTPVVLELVEFTPSSTTTVSS